MSKSLRLFILTAAIAVVGTLGATTAAQASRGISVNATRIGVSGVLTMNNVLVCDVLLALTLNSSTLTKTTTDQKGSVTGGTITNCNLASGGQILFPIPIFYTSFTGPLPAISNIRINAGRAGSPVGFRINDLSPIACPVIPQSPLYGGAVSPNLANVDLRVNAATGVVTAVDFNASSSLTETTATTCPNAATIRGTLTTFLGSAPIVRLV